MARKTRDVCYHLLADVSINKDSCEWQNIGRTRQILQKILSLSIILGPESSKAVEEQNKLSIQME